MTRSPRWQARRRQQFTNGDHVHTDLKNLNWDEVKAGIAKLLPYFRAVVKLTPTTLDDKAVDFLEALCNEHPDAVALIPDVK